MVGKVRTTTLVTKIRKMIANSDHPEAVSYMRNIDAIRQAYVR
jgi:hypothetical protein